MAASDYPMFEPSKVYSVMGLGIQTRRPEAHRTSSSFVGNTVAEEQRLRVAQSPNDDTKVATENPFHEQSLDNEAGGTPIEADPEPSEPPRQILKERERVMIRGQKRYFTRPTESSSKAKLADLTFQHHELNRRLLDAEATITDQEIQINGLTETITRLHLREGELAKDDIYFSTQFSDIASSVTAWTLKRFPRDLSVQIDHLGQLPDNLRQLIALVVPRGEDLNLLSKRESRLRVISSVVLEYLYSHLFSTLHGAMDAGNAILVIGPQLQGTNFQRQRWRSLTYNLLTKGTEYEANFHANVVTLAQALSQLVSVLASAPAVLDAGQRYDELLKLVECAARVSVEARKQLDIISLDRPKPGMSFDAKTMDDSSCTFELDELMAGGATVQIPLCPTIWRQSCGSDGSLSELSLVMKSKVWTVMDGDN